MTKVSFALIGCGTEGRALTRIARGLPAWQCVAVQDADPGRAQASAEEFAVESMESPEQLWSREEIGAVLVASPNDTHREIVEAALVAGKAVYVVPPLASTAQDGEALLAAAEEHQGKLLVGHTQRFHPLLAQLHRTVSLNSLGQPVAAHMVRREQVAWEEEARTDTVARTGGILWHWGLEDLAVLRAVFGEVATVYAQAGPQPIRAGLEGADVVSAQLRFESGLTVQWQLCLTDYLPSTYGGVMGTEGSLTFNLTQGVLHYRRSDGLEVKFEPNEVERAAFAREARETVLKNFAAWILEDTEPLISPSDVRAVGALAAAGIASLERNAVVSVAEMGGASDSPSEVPV